jgi:hypothetical protein
VDFLLVVASFLGCRAPDPQDPSDDTGGSDDSATDDSDPPDSNADDSDPDDSATDDSGPDDSGPDDSGPQALEVTTPTWVLDDDIGTVVVVTWAQSATATSHLEFLAGDDTAWQFSPPKERAAGTQSELVLGVPFDTDVTVRVLADDGTVQVTSEDVLAHTGPVPDDLPIPTLGTTDESAWVAEDRWLLIGAGNGGIGSEPLWKIIVDRRGRVVWALATPFDYYTMAMHVAPDGRSIVWDQNSFWTQFDEGELSTVNRTLIDGSLVETIATPGLHHTFLEIDDGSIVWGGILDDEEVVQERAPDGTVRVIWNCSEYWDAHDANPDCDGNGLFYNADDDTIYFSSDNENTVVEIDRVSGELVHVWGEIETAWAFADGSTAWWRQHSPTRTPEGSLMVSTWTSIRDSELVAREYRIDEKNQQLELVWECGAGSGLDVQYTGEAFRRANGNTFVNYGPASQVRELAPDCTVVWQLTWDRGSGLTHASFLPDLYALAP